ncbi:MAG: polyprenyl synthetase family protein [Oscillospiraceae bacterium]
MEFNEKLERYRALVENALKDCLTSEQVPYEKLLSAMRYSLLAGGKRLRPVLVLAFCEACGGDVDAALPVACGVEMLHTYSLIHDDLPCMDNDDLRRGKPTNHMVFGEFTATLAGDALQAEAFSSVLSADLSAERLVKCARALAEAAGHGGICGGQQLDMDGEGRHLSERELREIHLRKTSALIRGACLMGVYAAGGTLKQEKAAVDFADALGMAFQIRDDILDITSTNETLGKPVGSDAENSKTTFAVLFGIDESERLVRSYSDKAKKALEGAFEDTSFFDALADVLAQRNH